MSYKYKGVNFFAILVVFFLTFFIQAKSSFAAQLSRTTIRYNRVKINNPTNVYVQFVPTNITGVTKIKLSFGVGVGVSAVVGAGVSAETTNLGSGVVALPGTLTATKSGQDIIITGVTALSTGVTYGFNIAVGVSTPSTAGQSLDRVTTLTTGDAIVESSNLAGAFIVDDQITITANVPPIFTFTLSGNTDTFTTDLTPSAVSTTYGQSLTVSTNAAKGWTGWVKSQNVGLSSVTTSDSIPTFGTLNNTAQACSNGVDCYVLDVGISTTGSGAGSLTIDTEYGGNGTTSGGTLSNQYQPFASRTGKTAGDIVTFKAHASVISTKAAGTDYSDVLTIVGAGNF